MGEALEKVGVVFYSAAYTHVRVVVTHGVIHCSVLGPPNHLGASLQSLRLLTFQYVLNKFDLLQASERGAVWTREMSCTHTRACSLAVALSSHLRQSCTCTPNKGIFSAKSSQLSPALYTVYIVYTN